ncbi:PREDICTED: uncharacterized protein K02A2.6-like [Acropora digitifera]|uniref:uncharacterized protein K02A2.6-like n=1 Tax=Acropora digitifera TaxID=70779 RepID=UPI00077A54BC|nr:PREDICTED: uncharacterized protein K02A2.6-like [Acropora digitifera]
MRFRAKAEHVPVKELVVADTLSRNPLAAMSETSDTQEDVQAYVDAAEMERPASPENIEQIKLATASDPQLRRVLDYTVSRWPNQRKEPLIKTPLPERAWKKIGADLCAHQGKQFVVIIDYYSRFPEIAYMSSTTSDAVINKMKDIFARWGVPDEIVSDNGPQFSSEQFRKFSQEYDFKHFTTSPYYPQANGEAESGVRIAKKILRQRDPFLALMSYRATPHTATGVSPCQLMMGRDIRTLLPTLESNLRQVLPSQQAVAPKDEETKTNYPRHFDKRHCVRPLPELQLGNSVHVKLDQQKVWKTPGKVIARSPVPRSYIIQTPNRVVRRNRIHLRTVNSPRRVLDGQELDVNIEPRAEGPVTG